MPLSSLGLNRRLAHFHRPGPARRRRAARPRGSRSRPNGQARTTSASACTIATGLPVLADGPAATAGGMGGMGGMDHGSMGGTPMGTAPWGVPGDVNYPALLINGKPPTDPQVLTAKPGQQARLRIINAASDTIFTIALGGHRMTITHTDEHAGQPTEAGAF